MARPTPAVPTAVLALLLVTGCAGGAGDSGDSDERAGTAAVTSTTSTTPATPAASPPGFRPVTFHGITVDVPAAWSTDATECGTPVEPTVVLVHFSVPASIRIVAEPVPSLRLSPLHPGGLGAPTTAGVWTDTTVAGQPARRQDTAPGADSPNHRTDLVIPAQRAWISVTGTSRSEIDVLIASARTDAVDVNGCPVVIDLPDPLAVGRPPARPGADIDLLPDGVETLLQCTYGDGLIENSGPVPDPAVLVDAADSAPPGLSVTDPTTYLADICTDGDDWTSRRLLVTLTATYPDGPPVLVTARLAQCAPSGFSNGTVTRQVTEASLTALMKAASQEGAPGAWIPAP